MTDTTDSPSTSGFNRRKFIAGAVGTVVAPLAARAADSARRTRCFVASQCDLESQWWEQITHH
jgi:hypothetical protein